MENQCYLDINKLTIYNIIIKYLCRSVEQLGI